MSSRADIDRRLVYSCNCGWLDLGHANPISFRDGEGAESLWKQMVFETNATRDTIAGKPCFRVFYRQTMRKGRLGAGMAHVYLVKKGISVSEKESIALAIFAQVSYGFEGLQSTFPFSLVTDSGFSQEDLVSNLIGFHRAVKGMSEQTVRQLCGVVSKDASLKVWDTHLKDGIEALKNKSFDSPNYYPCDECDGPGSFPAVFRSIRAQMPMGSVVRYPFTPGPNWPVLTFDERGRLRGNPRIEAMGTRRW